MGRFLRLTFPSFFSAPGEDAHKFLIAYEDRLCNLSLVETRGMYYIIFLFDLAVGYWWRGYIDSRSAGSSPLTWT